MSAETKIKVVMYLGVVYEIPSWANYIAADSDGDVCAYESEPEWDTKEAMYLAGEGRCKTVLRTTKAIPPCLFV